MHGLQVDSAAVSAARIGAVSTPGLYDGLSVAAQKASQTGNFTQSLGAATASLTNSSLSIALPTAG